MNKGSQERIFNRVLIELKSYRTSIVLSILSAFATVYFTLRIPILIGNAVDQIVFSTDTEYTYLFFILRQMQVTIVATFFTQWIMNRINNSITYNVTKNLRDRAFAKLQHMRLSQIDSHPHGDYVSRIVSDADTFADGLLMGFTQFFTGVLTILGTIYFMLMISVKIALIVIIATPASLLLAKLAQFQYSFFEI